MAIKQKLARKAVKSTAKHTAHGTASKIKRDPVRASSLLVLGALLGLIAGLVLGRVTGGGDPSPAEPAISPVEPGIPPAS